MVSGSDCHGTPITVQADKEKTTPQEIVKKYHKKDLELFEQYDLSYNLYTTTTTENHKKVTQQLFLDLLENGYIIKDTMKQYYSAEDKEFLPDRYVEGTCPHCGAKEQRSDQCENCGRWLKDGELLDPVSKRTGKKVELKDSEHYFLDFGKLQKDLDNYITGKLDGKDKKKIWRDWVYKETAGWLKEGMEKRAITRDLDWGVELPIDRIPKDLQIGNIEKKKIYVWFEAVIGYLSAPQEWSELVKEFSPTELKKEITDDYIFRFYKGQAKDWKEWWLNPDCEIYNFMGQDNLVFHTLMWPGELIGANKGRAENEKYTLPHNVVVNKFMNFNDAKFSKSRGNIVDSGELAEKFGTDAVRYFVLANLPENKETNFTWERFIDAVNNELVANLGNFINRTLVFYSKNFKGKISGDPDVFYNTEYDSNIGKGSLGGWVDYTFKNCEKNLIKCEFVEALKQIMLFSSYGNKYFNDSEIWKLIKMDQKKAEKIMFNFLNIVEALRLLMRPFLPEAYEKLTKMLGLEIDEPEVGKNNWQFNSISGYPNLKEVKPLFAKIDKEIVLKALEAK